MPGVRKSSKRQLLAATTGLISTVVKLAPAYSSGGEPASGDAHQGEREPEGSGARSVP